jgi:hypothetical protein
MQSDDHTTVEATAELASGDLDTVVGADEQTVEPTRSLTEEETLQLRVLVDELGELWERRERIRHEQPVDVGPDGQEVFADEADDVAIRRFQRLDEQIAQTMLANQGLLIRRLVSS